MNQKLTYIVIGVLIIIVALVSRTCSSNRDDLVIANQNIKALTGRTIELTNKLGQVQSERDIFMGDVEMLRGLTTDLMKELETQKGNVRVVTRIVTKIIYDTIVIDNTVDKINDSTYNIKFSYKKDYDTSNSIILGGNVPATVRIIDGKASLESKSTTISDLQMNMKLYTGLKEQDGLYNIYARTDFPNVKFDLEGAVIDPEKSFIDRKKPFTLMVGGGFGYGLSQNGVGFFPSVGLYVGINLFRF